MFSANEATEDERDDIDDDGIDNDDTETENKEPIRGIEFFDKSPPIYVLFGQGKVSLNSAQKSVVSIESGTEELNTVKAEIRDSTAQIGHLLL